MLQSKILSGLFLSVVLGTLVACPSKEPPLEKKESPSTVSQGFGSVKGLVTFSGQPLKSKELSIEADPNCVSQHKAKKISAQDVMISNGNVQNAFVYFAKVPAGSAGMISSEPVTLDQKGCMYHPRIIGLQVGQTLEILNSDPMLHNVHANSGGKSIFNFAMTSAGQKNKKSFKKPQVMVHIKCDVHPWMTAYVGVLDHPFFQVTGSDGAFQFDKVPSGTYTLRVWHERLGTLSQEINITADQESPAKFAYQRDQ